MVGIAAPQADLGAAAIEFLIGLLAVALRPTSAREWRRWWDEPPTPEELTGRLMELPAAFALDGDGIRVFQDADLDRERPVVLPKWHRPAEHLLIPSPTGKTLSDNTDLFVRRARVERLGLPAASTALMAMQTYAPEGGQGHRSSMRGGGPLTTVVDPRVGADITWRAHEDPLWRLLWANVPLVSALHSGARTAAAEGAPLPWPKVFPWMTATRTSEDDRPTSPADVHELQAFFGLPRRIRLEFGGPGRCDLTGRDEEQTVVGFWMRPYGVKYEQWVHPLSPYGAKREKNGTTTWLPAHGQPGGLAWRDWLGMAVGEVTGTTRKPAACVTHFTTERAGDAGLRSERELRLVAWGYDFKSFSPRGWVNAEYPAYAVSEPDARDLLTDTARRLVGGARLAEDALVAAVNAVWFGRGKKTPGDRAPVRQALWAGTEAAFFAALRAVAQPGATFDDAAAECARFRRDALERTTLAVFDRHCPMATSAPGAVRTLVSARHALAGTLRGWGKSGRGLFAALGLAPPAPPRPTASGPPSQRHTRRIA